MTSTEMLNRYGIYSFEGIHDANQVNNDLIKAVCDSCAHAKIKAGEVAYTILNMVLDELYYKVEKISTGHSSGFRLYTTMMGEVELTYYRNVLTQKVVNVLQNYWSYDVVLKGDALVSSKVSLV